MMRIGTRIALVVVALGVAWTVGRARPVVAQQDVGAAAAPQSPAKATPAAAAFERMKSLAGRWEAKIENGPEVSETFRVVAAGSALMQLTEFKGAPQNVMITMYHLDGDRLLLTHYCMAKNQPRMVASEFGKDLSSITFTYLDATGMKSRDVGHMDSATFWFVDDNHFRDRWNWYQEGAESAMHEVTYTRGRRS